MKKALVSVTETGELDISSFPRILLYQLNVLISTTLIHNLFSTSDISLHMPVGTRKIK